MSEYYLKRCGYQELGSIGADGKAHRGRYLLTSMNESVLSFFPPLSRTQKNDSALLPIIPLYSGEKVYCNYVYHNDKFHDSTAAHPRNEYRIYLNRSLEGDYYRFKQGDIVVFRKQVIDEDGIEQTVYLMDLVHSTDSEYYRELNRIIANSPIQGGYGNYIGTLGAFEAHADAILGERTPQTIIDTTVTDRIINNPVDIIANLFNPASFRDFVMTGYGNLCAITGTVIQFQAFTNLEAAHIKPRSHGGFFTLDDELKVVVHPEINSDFLWSFNGHSIRVPENRFFAPDLLNIRYHRDNIFGLFLTTGRL